jgi:hypothetical protein
VTFVGWDRSDQRQSPCPGQGPPLELLEAAYPAHTAIKLILDNHFAHISRETKAGLTSRPCGRFDFTFTPKHGSWLNLIEGSFSKFARSVLRHIRVASKQELKQRIMAGIKDVNRRPVMHIWSPTGRLIGFKPRKRRPRRPIP